MAKTVFKWVLLILLMAYVAGMTVWARQEGRQHICKGIDVLLTTSHPADTTTRQGIMSELEHYPGKIAGAPLSSINTHKIERFLSSLNAFEKVDCAIAADSRLQIVVTPMIPEIRVFDTNGKSYYVNKDGKRITSNAEFFVDVPVVQGHFTDKFPARSVIPIAKYIRDDNELNTLIAGIKVQDADNILLVPRIRGHLINFGDTSRLDAKKRAILTAYRSIMPRKGWNEYDTISVKFKGQIVATRRNKPVIDHGDIVEQEIDLEEATLPEAKPAAPQKEAQEKTSTTEE